MKLMKDLSKFQGPKIGVMLVASFIVSMIFLSISKPFNELSLSIPSPRSSLPVIKINTPQNGYQSVKLKKPLCDITQNRSEICEMDGDIRTHGNSSTIISISQSSRRNESYNIRPYARKGDDYIMAQIRELQIKSEDRYQICAIKHNIPAIIFSTQGYVGNIFHDFTDILMPLFATSFQFHGEVQFLITDFNPWWILKYRKLIDKLSNYELIDFDKDNNVRCFQRVIVGLRSHKELTIIPEKIPNNYSAIDFTRFIKNAYNLTYVTKNAKPKLMIISRARTRGFMNLHEIISLAKEVGFDTVIAEAKIASDMEKFAKEVNECDVLMGVHGAGLTNMIYLPENSSIIQVVPWGGLGWVSRYDFGYSAADMGLKYLQYEIKAEESSLIEVYSKDHDVFKNPLKYHEKGWHLLRTMFMDKQNVRIDVERFRPFLVEAFEFARKKKNQN